MDGLRALELIRQAQPEIKVIMVRAELTMGKVSAALANGAAGVIVKPFIPARVLDKIADFMKQRGWHGR